MASVDSVKAEMEVVEKEITGHNVQVRYLKVSDNK
jgi:hypothetical protein